MSENRHSLFDVYFLFTDINRLYLGKVQSKIASAKSPSYHEGKYMSDM